MCPRLSTNNADGFTVGVAIQLQFFMMSIAFSIHFDGLRWCGWLNCFQTVKFTQFVDQILHQVILGKAHLTKYLQTENKTQKQVKVGHLSIPSRYNRPKQKVSTHSVHLTRIQTIAIAYAFPFLKLPMHQLVYTLQLLR